MREVKTGWLFCVHRKPPTKLHSNDFAGQTLAVILFSTGACPPRGYLWSPECMKLGKTFSDHWREDGMCRTQSITLIGGQIKPRGHRQRLAKYGWGCFRLRPAIIRAGRGVHLHHDPMGVLDISSGRVCLPKDRFWSFDKAVLLLTDGLHISCG